MVKLIIVIILPHFSPVAADDLSFNSDEIIINIKPTVYAGLLSGTRKLDGSYRIFPSSYVRMIK